MIILHSGLIFIGPPCKFATDIDIGRVWEFRGCRCLIWS